MMKPTRTEPRSILPAVVIGIGAGCSFGTALHDAATGFALGAAFALIFSFARMRSC